MKITYTLIIAGQTIITRKLTEAYKAYDKAIAAGQTVEKFVSSTGANIADR